MRYSRVQQRLELLSEVYIGIPETIATQEIVEDIRSMMRSSGEPCGYRQAGLEKRWPDAVSLQQLAQGRVR